jgi:hypothetical protein
MLQVVVAGPLAVVRAHLLPDEAVAVATTPLAKMTDGTATTIAASVGTAPAAQMIGNAL